MGRLGKKRAKIGSKKGKTVVFNDYEAMLEDDKASYMKKFCALFADCTGLEDVFITLTSKEGETFEMVSHEGWDKLQEALYKLD